MTCYIALFLTSAAAHATMQAFKVVLCCRRGTGQASLASVRELLRGERFALSSAEVDRLVQQLGIADDSDVVRYDEWAAAMISWKTVSGAHHIVSAAVTLVLLLNVFDNCCRTCGPDVALPALTASSR